MTQVVRIHETGDAGRLVAETVEPPVPGVGEALIGQHSAGVNFVDIYHRTGVYPVPALPAILGVEGAGVVERIGERVTGVTVGDRVAYMADLAAYRTAAESFIGLVAGGRIGIRVGAHYPLAEAGRAHEDLEAGRTTGTVLLSM